MGTISNTVYYCCVSNGGTILYAYNSMEDLEIEKLVSLCLQKSPSHHKWYFQTKFGKTFGYLMDDGYVYFAIFDGNLGSSKSLEFLEGVRDAFNKVAKKRSKKRIMANPNSPALQEQLLPVIQRLISSLDHVSESTTIPSPYNGQTDLGASTKAPLLGKSSKQEKRKMGDHVITVRENNGAVEEHRKVDSSLSKEASSMSRSRAQTVRNKWCRQVRIVLAIDVAVCLILFVVWMVVCRGTECIR